MKKLCFLFIILLGLTACGGGGGEADNDASGPRELAENETISATIDNEGEVDWYTFNAVETNRTLVIDCTGTHRNAPVDFMMTVFETDSNGDRVPLFGKSAPEDAVQPADLQILVHIDRPKRLYIAVRDFMDDDASDRVPYRLEVHYADEATDTGTFAQAEQLEVDAASCHSDSISQVGEVNTYTFTIANEGVYRLGAQYDVSNPATVSVNLGIELYDDGGQMIYAFKEDRPQDLTYAVLVHLVPGTYYVVIDDQGRNDTDAANYTVCVDSVSVDEMAANDDQASSQSVSPVAGEYDLGGSLEYLQDQDWYEVAVPTATAPAFQNVTINFARGMATLPESISNLTDPGSYRISVLDEEGNILHAYSHAVTIPDPYTVQFAAGNGDVHYVVVQPIIDGQMVAALDYQLSVGMTEVLDENENGEEITVLDPNGETVEGKISTLGDVDNYQITVDTTGTDRVVELFFDTYESSLVSYALHVMWDGNHMILRDINGTGNGADEGAHFKSSYYLPLTVGDGTEVNLQVVDDQNNDGSNVEYTLTVNILDIPTGTLPTISGHVDDAPVHHTEIDERDDGTALDITMVEYDSTGQPEHKANTSLLRVDALDSSNQWQSEWIAGFVDYAGDRDLFQLNFDDITEAVGAPEDWYFDIQVEFYAQGSDVEYGWSLFRDSQPNGILLERTFWQDETNFEYDYSGEGVIASWADSDLDSNELDITVPRTVDEEFWIGHRWEDSRFYIGIQDFNRALISNDPVLPNQVPDNDWGNTSSADAVEPYHFRVTVTFHADCSSPTECSP